jgi:hypothetical protein
VPRRQFELPRGYFVPRRSIFERTLFSFVPFDFQFGFSILISLHGPRLYVVVLILFYFIYVTCLLHFDVHYMLRFMASQVHAANLIDPDSENDDDDLFSIISKFVPEQDPMKNIVADRHQLFAENAPSCEDEEDWIEHAIRSLPPR